MTLDPDPLHIDDADGEEPWRSGVHHRGCPLFTHPTQRKPGHPTNCTCGATGPDISGKKLATIVLTCLAIVVVLWWANHYGIA